MKYWPILILLLSADPVRAQVQIDGRNSYSLAGNVFIMKEDGSPLSINGSWEDYTQGKFKPIAITDNSFNIGFVRNVYWVAIPLGNRSDSPQSFEAGIDNGGVFHLEFYLLSADGRLIDKHLTGTNYAFATRAIPNRHFYFPVTLAPGMGAVILYRIDMRGNGLHIPMQLLKKGEIQLAESRLALFYCFFSGWLFFVSFFSLLAFVLTKARVYLFYCLYVTSYWMFFVGDGNFDVEWLYPHWPVLTTIAPAIYALCICFFMLLFMSDFLLLRSTHAGLYRLSRVWALLIVSVMILLPCGFVFSTNINLRVFVFFYCLATAIGAWSIQIYCIVRRIRDKFKPAYLYGVALIGVILAGAFYMSHVLGIVPDLIPTYLYISLAFAIEITLLSFALVYSYDFYKKQSQHLSLALASQKLEFSTQLLRVQETEQKRIARDLHDELGGNLAAIKMNLQSMHLKDGDSGKMIQLIDIASASARNIAHNLMPPEFEKTKMTELLQNYFNKLNREGKLCFNFFSTGDDDHFDKQDDLIIYRICLELTNNIIRHSRASEATIQLINYDSYLELMVEDNGKGFADANSDGIGLKNIRSRVDYLMGRMEIDTGEHGTTIMIKLPYKK